MCYGTIAKILVGIALVVTGLWVLLPIGAWPSGIAWNEFKTVLIGTVPVLAVLIGVLLVWIESEELKAELSKKRKR